MSKFVAVRLNEKNHIDAALLAHLEHASNKSGELKRLAFMALQEDQLIEKVIQRTKEMEKPSENVPSLSSLNENKENIESLSPPQETHTQHEHVPDSDEFKQLLRSKFQDDD